MAGRPSSYNQDIVDELCEKIANSNKSLRALCEENAHFPAKRTIMQWLKDNSHPEFSLQYARAKEEQAEFLAEEILKIADGSENDTILTDEGAVIPNHEWINRSRLRVDTRKWLASKLAPKKYGDKIDVTTDGKEISNTPPQIIINHLDTKVKMASDESDIDDNRQDSV